jgi:uncharacterized membrane protein required for colicin V production
MTLTIYDAAMAGVLVAGMVWGAWKGVTWQLASIASLILGYMVSHQLSVQLAPHFPGDPVVSRALAMMAIYAAVSGGVFLVAWSFRAILRKMKFEAFDRHLGMLLGGMEAALLGILATFFVVSLAPSTRDPIFSSPSGKLVGNLMNAAGPILPSEAREALAPFIAEAKQAIATGEKVLPLLPTQTLPPSKDAELQRTSETNDGTVERR